jgi:hypothetical protein
MARQPFWRESQRLGIMEMGRERQVAAHALVSDFCVKIMAVIPIVLFIVRNDLAYNEKRACP